MSFSSWLRSWKSMLAYSLWDNPTRRPPRRVHRAGPVGLEPLEDVITYELDGVSRCALASQDLSVMRVAPGDQMAIDSLVQIDHAAFPWLWRNSR